MRFWWSRWVTHDNTPPLPWMEDVHRMYALRSTGGCSMVICGHVVYFLVRFLTQLAAYCCCCCASMAVREQAVYQSRAENMRTDWRAFSSQINEQTRDARREMSTHQDYEVLWRAPIPWRRGGWLRVAVGEMLILLWMELLVAGGAGWRMKKVGGCEW